MWEGVGDVVWEDFVSVDVACVLFVEGEVFGELPLVVGVVVGEEVARHIVLV